MSTAQGATFGGDTSRKRARTETHSRGSDVQGSELDEASGARSRGSTACEKCRSRKTRCDGQRPSCGFCVKKNHTCVYPDDGPGHNSCAFMGTQILDAIHNLSQTVNQSQALCASCRSERPTHYPSDNGIVLHSPPDTQRAGPAHATPSDFQEINDIASFQQATVPSVHTQGLETILAWKSLLVLRSPGCLFASDKFAIPLNVPLPKIGIDELCRLEDKYIEGIHSKNPILDLVDLHEDVLHVAENGLDWSTRTCLVTLVCAIGAITQPYQDYHMSPSSYHTPGAPQALTDDDQLGGTEPDLSVQFWNLAVKRLGHTIGQIDLQAAQCLCLAGIWYMHQMEPLRALQYFNLAGFALNSINIIENTSIPEQSVTTHPSSSFTVLQALSFTIWKSVCEIRIEIPNPGSFVNIWLPDDFPNAPMEDFPDSDLGPVSKRRIWYYYLAEIAARHQINRIVNTLVWSNDSHRTKAVIRMLTLAETLEGHLEEWRSSLPTAVSFQIPEGDSIPPHPDPMIQILRSRYLSARELIGRHFVRLYVETDLPYESAIRARVLHFASQCLRYCMLKLSQVAPHRHQGTWFGLRNAAAATLIIGAVHLRDQNAASDSTNDLLLPEGWRARISETAEVLRPFWAHSRGGASQIGKLIQSVLNECDSEVQISI